MIYRSPVTRWTLALFGFVAGALLAFGDKARFQSAPSLRELDKVPYVSLSAWGVAFMVYALLLLPNRTRPLGYLAGGVLFGVFALSLIVSSKDVTFVNTVIIAAVLDVIVFHFYSVRTAWSIRDAHEEARKVSAAP